MSKITRFYIMSFLTFAFLLLTSNFAFALSLNIDPSNIKLVVKPGETKSGEIIVQNTGSSQLQIKAYTEDWIYAPDGSKNFMKPGSSVNSCSTWIKLNADKFELAPREERKVSFDIAVPKNASGGHVSVIFFESLISVKEGIAVSGRIGTIIYQDTEGDIKRSGEIKGISVAGSREGEPVIITISLLNKGNTYISARPKITVLKDNKAVVEPKMNPLNALQGDTANGSVNIGPLKEGKYKIKAELSYNDKSLTSQHEFAISKK